MKIKGLEEELHHSKDRGNKKEEINLNKKE